MYRYVTEKEVKPYRNYCSETLAKLRDLLNKVYGINTQFSLVGSGGSSRNMVTRDGNGPFDLDYNLVILNMPNEYQKDLKKLKDTVRNSLNEIVKKEYFTDGKDSRSVITSILHFSNSSEVKFSFDIAILAKNNQGNFCRLIHNKGYQKGFTWNEILSSHNVKELADRLKREGLWNEVRNIYLNKKNMYLQRGDNNHPSFIVYVESVNEVYNKNLKTSNNQNSLERQYRGGLRSDIDEIFFKH